MIEEDILNCAECPFRTNTDGRMCQAAVVPALALLIRRQIIDKNSIADRPEDLLHSLLGLAPVGLAAQLACEAVMSVKLELTQELAA